MSFSVSREDEQGTEQAIATTTALQPTFLNNHWFHFGAGAEPLICF